MIPQIIFILLVGLNIGATMFMHGKPRSNYNFWATSINLLLITSLLYWGGFFNCFFN